MENKINELINKWTYDLNADGDEFGNLYKDQFVITGYDIGKLKDLIKDLLCEGEEK